MPPYEFVLLEDDVVELRPWRVEDAAVMAAGAVDPDIARFCMMPPGYTSEMARQFIVDAPRAWEEDGWLHLALVPAGSDEPAGALGVLRVDRTSRSGEFGYWLLPQWRGHGLAHAAVSLTVEWAFATLELRRLVIGTMVANHASRRIARTLGFVPEAMLRSYRPFGTGRTDCVAYSLLREEWRGEGRTAAPEPDETLLPALAAARNDYPAAATEMPPTPPPLGDGRVLLRPYSAADLADLVAACNDPDTQRWLDLLPQPYTAHDGREFLARTERSWRETSEAFYCITDAADGRLLGGCGLDCPEAWAGVGEIGYHVAPWARRRGVATAAARLVAQWGLDVLGLGRVQILADTRNEGSCGVARRLGFTREGVRRRDHGRAGDEGDHAVFSLLPADPRPW